jgi:two-component sensor histidine kinase
MKAAPHPDQARRLAALRRYGILDTPREAEFDEIVGLAAELCGAPIGVINLIDESRQWFKSEQGLGVRETPLDTSICSHVILEDEFVEISDTHGDARTRDNPLCVADTGLRFYAGAQLQTPEGLPIGTLCVLDNQPRQLTDFQKRALKALARQVMRELELRLAIRQREALHGEMDHRVKNSLANVSAILKIYRSRSTAESAEAFDAVARRIDAISLLHQELHDTNYIERVPMGSFIPRILALLRAGAPAGVTITHQVDDILLLSSEASAVAIIISEFVANSLKHAFPDGRPGDIRITIVRNTDGSVMLDCRDDGAGSHAAPRSDTAAKGLGLRLIDAAASQLGGVIERRAMEPGYLTTVTFQPRSVAD